MPPRGAGAFPGVTSLTRTETANSPPGALATLHQTESVMRIPLHTVGFATLSIAMALTLSSCATSGVNRGDFNLISIDEEWQLGQQLHAEISRQLPLVNDAATLSFINRIGQRIVNETEMANLPWEFHVVADPSINAFNIPGGHVYVHTGLIQQVDDVAELAGVMGHEIAHGVARHATERLTKAYGIQLGAGVLLGQDPGIISQIVAQIVGQGAIAKFSRDDERESDDLGVRYLYNARYDPDGMVDLFRKLIAQRQSSPSRVTQFFSTHPLTEERIRNVQQEIAKMPNRSDLVTNDPQLATVKQRVSRS